jgi:hypothetical protein
MNKFEFELDQNVAMEMSGEKGIVIGRSEFSTRPSLYFVRYVAADGRQCESWEDASALVAVE